ncbi:hypothetical protein LOTGIDRAFT_232407 [Lottia gigantea]|uniref:PHD finger protein 14 n=1 Tax=Lottia gigantea TaxID=225164 RepID=V3ZRT1_LOTGI|nr:hypothetical protein LOTGIDRAFT_232407 [Lottia gigantea]ESO94133.1 hypothetical protein LOTGIDRAFT_232407 [Lottia gigantea]
MENLYMDDVDPSVSFLFKTMLERDPKKRRVKPVQKHMIQVDFGGGEDSDEDSDFDMKKHKANSDGEDSDDKVHEPSDEGDVNNDDEESDDDDDDDDDNDNSESDSDESQPGKPGLDILNMDLDSADDEDYVPNQKKKKLLPSSVTKEITESLEAPTPPPVIDNQDIKIVICCVCLTDVTGADDEIVECDNCGVPVHEGCYGISDNQSAASTESSASTEPWFCDACKAGVKPSCELCPNFGGIFKETDTGKWVHLVCALYTPGVAFGDVDKLSPITLFEMPYSRWGARECTLCEDVRFSRTGVCVSCDAGMCRSYFHVTCAQREGLLSEASPEEVMDIADPFYAYCKLHADKNTARAKRRNWLAIQSRVKKLREKVIEDTKEKARFERKLKRHCEKYTIARQKRPPSWVPTQKMVRFLTSSPSAVRNMLRKAELMGVITNVQTAPNQKQESRKKGSSATPALSTDFITHYLERNVRIDNMKNNLKDLVQQNSKLHEQEKILRQRYDKLLNSSTLLKDKYSDLKEEGEGLWKNLIGIGGKTIKLPDILKPKKITKSPTIRDTPKSPPAIIHQCGICKKTTDQHQLAKCDLCKLYYHLGCLDPPLTRMPKKTKLMGWQCSECVSSSSDSEKEVTVEDVDGPRRLRETIKEPLKFQFMEMYDFKKREKIKKRSKTKKKVKKTEAETSIDITPDDIPVKKSKVSPQYRPKNLASSGSSNVNSVAKKKESPKELMVECVVCSQPGRTSNTVRCDECQLCYHFTCLNPPVKKSPKIRGYGWHCEACDPTDDSDDIGLVEDEDSKLSPPPQEGSVNTSDDDVMIVEQVD